MKSNSFLRMSLAGLVPILMLLFTVVVRAQQPADDVITLKDGTILRGKIFEEVPKKYVKLQTPDGKIREYKFSSIKNITHAPVPQAATPVETVRETIDTTAAEPTPALSPTTSTPAQTRPLQTTGVRGPVTFSERKSPALSFVLSFLIPGLGQFYNGEYVKGGIQTGAYVAGVGMMLMWGRASSYSAEPYTDYSYYGSYTYYRYYDEDYTTAWMYIGAGVAAGSWIWSMIDAPTSANRINDEYDNGGYGHMIEMRSDQYVLGLDLGPQAHGMGARAVVHLP